MAETADSDVRAAGRGVVWIAAAKGTFMVAGYAIEFGLARLLGVSLFGVYKLVVGGISVLNNTVVTGTIQSVSRFTSEDEARADAVKRAAFRLQLLVGGGVAIGYVLLAPVLARFWNDTTITPLLRLSAVIVFCYAFYAVFVGSANGLRRFHVQAGLDMTYSTLRAALTLGLAALTLRAAGAVGGFAAASALILGIAALWVGPGRAGPRFPARRLGSYGGQLLLYTLLLNLLMLVDLFILKRRASWTDAGTYAAAQTLARIPYQGVLSLAFVAFPLVSRAAFDQDAERTRAYVEQTMRATLLFCTAAAAVFVACPRGLLALLYRKPEFLRAEPALVLLAPGQVLFALIVVGNTILNAAGRTRDALATVAVTCALAASAVGAAVFLAGGRVLVPAAASQTAAMAVGFTMVVMQLRRRFSAALPAGTALRVILAFSLAVLAGHLVPDGGAVRTLAECALAFATFCVVLAALREFTSQDLARLRRIVGR
jgi:O-antigen/teichoic acid export membrane protein